VLGSHPGISTRRMGSTPRRRFISETFGDLLHRVSIKCRFLMFYILKKPEQIIVIFWNTIQEKSLQQGALNIRGWENFANVAFPFISETVEDSPIVTVEH